MLKLAVLGCVFVGVFGPAGKATALSLGSGSPTELELRRAIQARRDRDLASFRADRAELIRKEKEHQDELERERLAVKEAEFAAEEVRLQAQAEEATLARRIAVTQKGIEEIRAARDQGITQMTAAAKAAGDAAVLCVEAKIEAGHQSIAQTGTAWAQHERDVTAAGRAEIKADLDKAARQLDTAKEKTSRN